MDAYDLLKQVLAQLKSDKLDGRTKAGRALKKRLIAKINAAQERLWQKQRIH